jgi:hypothetical protein
MGRLMLWTLAVGLGTELVLQAGWWEFLQRSNWYGNITFRDYSVFNASWLCSTVFIHEYFHGNNLYETMYHLFNYWSFLYIYSCNLGDRIQDSNVSDMKFGWLNLFASRMSSYLNVLFTRWLQVDTLDGAGPIKAWFYCCLRWKND